MTEKRDDVRLRSRIWSILRALIFICVIYFIWIGMAKTASAFVLIALIMGWVNLYQLRSQEIEKPYYRLWLNVVDGLLQFSVMTSIFIRDIYNSESVEKLLGIGCVVILARLIAHTLFSLGVLREGKKLPHKRRWSKLANLATTITMGVYLLNLEDYQQICMVATILLILASTVAYAYWYYRDPSHRKPLSIASQLTMSRIVLTPFFLWVFFYDNDLDYSNNSLVFKVLALVMVLGFMLTDFLDGKLARAMGEVSTLGKYLDPFSDKISNDTAFLDRLSFFLPGWEIIKFAPHHFTNHFGFSTDFFSEWMHHQRRKSYVNAIDDFFSEFLHSQRKTTYTDAIDRYFTLGAQMKQRDTKPVRKTVSGLIKLMHPDGEFTKEDVRKYLVWAIEMRRRVKEQLKRIGGMEFWDTNFSYIDKETQEEFFVSVPEERGTNLIEDAPLQPGTCYTATSDGDKVSLVKIEVITMPGNGKLSITGSGSTEAKEDIKNTYNYIRANERAILSQQHSLLHLDVTVQVTVLLGVGVQKGIGGAVFAGIVSSVFGRNLKAGLGVIGNISIGGAIERALNFNDRVSLLSENGAKNVLVPMDNLSEMATLPATVLGKTDIPLYANTQMLIQKMI